MTELAEEIVPVARRRARGWALGVAGSGALLAAATLGGDVIGYLSKAACWPDACYSDITPLYFGEGLARGQVPYLHHPVEYPVLTGAAMEAAAWLVRHSGAAHQRDVAFFGVSAALLALCGIAAVFAVRNLAGPGKRWTALMVALAPAAVLCAFINWDLLAMSLAMLGLAAWAARRGVLAGVLLGLAVAAKFYPVVFFWPLLLVCCRAGRLRAFWVTVAAAAAAWLAVNLPVAIAAPTGWSWFYHLSESRGADWGSIWIFFRTERWSLVGNLSPAGLNLASGLALCLLFGILAVLALAAPRRPRLPQLLFLAVAAFLLVNKVWSPQYVIWLVPLAVLARPRLPAFALWQLAEIGYYFAVWPYVLTTPGTRSGAGRGIQPGLYFAALTARFDAVLLLVVLVVRDILRPDLDIVRSTGRDDPAGGVLVDAPDRVVLRVRRTRSGRIPADRAMRI